MSYQRLLKSYLIPPCLTLSNIRYVSRVKWSNRGKGVAPSPTPRCSSYGKGAFGPPRLRSPTFLIYICIYELHSISFQPFFEHAFKIVVDIWKVSILLLYILWNDWPIFMISGSNELLQQKLEYTLLMPDCHSWRITKMQSGREDTLEERYAIKFCFKLGKNATATYGMLQTAFQPSCMNRVSAFEWYKRLKEGRESVRVCERCGRSKEVNRPELIGQRVRVRVRVRVIMLRFWRSSGGDSVGRGKHSWNVEIRLQIKSLFILLDMQWWCFVP